MQRKLEARQTDQPSINNVCSGRFLPVITDIYHHLLPAGLLPKATVRYPRSVKLEVDALRDKTYHKQLLHQE